MHFAGIHTGCQGSLGAALNFQPGAGRDGGEAPEQVTLLFQGAGGRFSGDPRLAQPAQGLGVRVKETDDRPEGEWGEEPGQP